MKKAAKTTKVKVAEKRSGKPAKKKPGADFTPYRATYTGARWGWAGKTVSVIGPDSYGGKLYRRAKLGTEEHNVSLSHLKKVGGSPAAAPASKKKAKATEKKSGAPVPVEVRAM